MLTNFENKRIKMVGQSKINDVSDAFASLFYSKIKSVVNSVEIDEEVYSGRRVINFSNKMFMDSD
jgi:hypothetical protein